MSNVIKFPERRGQKKVVCVATKDQLIQAAIEIAKEQKWTAPMMEHMVREMQEGDSIDATEIFEADFADIATVRWV
jgi:hypothetical protein